MKLEKDPLTETMDRKRIKLSNSATEAEHLREQITKLEMDPTYLPKIENRAEIIEDLKKSLEKVLDRIKDLQDTIKDFENFDAKNLNEEAQKDAVRGMANIGAVLGILVGTAAAFAIYKGMDASNFPVGDISRVTGPAFVGMACASLGTLLGAAAGVLKNRTSEFINEE